MSQKILESHLSRSAYVYLRQSTMGQVKCNQESTQRQYALKNKALSMGWGDNQIKILDGDLGISGTQSNNREDFKALVADVSMKKVGSVFALEASRLSRSCADWHRLLELCSLTGTLIIDEDGCYDPSDFNDQLLLNMKGTMSYAELHFIRARLDGGRNNKAKKGDLRSLLPIGFVYDREKKTILDPDIQIRKAVQLLFDVFDECGSAFGVMQYFVNHNLQFPKRAYGGLWNGKIIWGALNHSRVVGILRNPSYAGAYAYGKCRYEKRMTSEGSIKTDVNHLPMESWKVLIKDHHEGYVSWDKHLKNRHILENNRTHEKSTGPVRKGEGLLQGLLICKICGHRLTVSYKLPDMTPAYQCAWRKRNGISHETCMGIKGVSLDKAVSERILEIMKPVQLNIAVEALEEVERREVTLNNQWLMRIQRAEYEANLAQRSYEEVDPSNRLVAATLEKKWNDALENLANSRNEYECYREKNTLHMTTEQKQQIKELAEDLPRLWNAPTTQARDRKRILRLLIKDITIERKNEERNVVLYIRWQGGATEEMRVPFPLRTFDKYRTPKEIIEIIRKLAMNYTDEKIVDHLNAQGLKSGKGNAFTVASVQWIRHKNSIPFCHPPRAKDEFGVPEVAQKFGISPDAIYYWIKHNFLKEHQIKRKPYRIILDSETEETFKRLIQNSKLLQKRIKEVPL